MTTPTRELLIEIGTEEIPSNHLSALGEHSRTQGVGVADLERLDTAKGEVLAVRKHVPGRPAAELLAEALPELLRTLPQPKAMRWGAERFAFLRPLHWILALLGDQVIPATIAGVAAGRETRGHRFRGNQPLVVGDRAAYDATLAAHHVVPGLDARAASIAAQLEAAVDALAKAAPLPAGRQYQVREALADHDFLREVANLTESPRVLVGSFDPKHLEIPADILVTAMKHHQRYFPIWDAPLDGQGEPRRLTNRFAVVTNLPGDAPDATCRTVVAGNERVLRARLADAAFFVGEDRKRPLASFVDALGGRIFLQGLGTVRDKVTRLEALSGGLCDLLAGLAPCFQGDAFKARARRTALLAKADLSTAAVGEFPELQGIMGRHYALAEGEEPAIAQAIDEHYQPRFAGDAIPATREGTVVSLADKLDSIVGAFALGLEPTGSQDPYALRRQAIGVLRILLQEGAPTAGPHGPAPLDLDLDALVGAAADALGPDIVKDRAALVARVVEFLLGRFRVMLLEGGADANAIAAVLGTGVTRPVDLAARVAALQAIRGSADFEPMMVAFRRVMNITKDHADVAFARDGLEAPAELALADAFAAMSAPFDRAVAEHRYADALQAIVGLKPAIDRFFDEVLVMAEDPALRTNRLGLVRSIADRFRAFADFSRIQV